MSPSASHDYHDFEEVADLDHRIAKPKPEGYANNFVISISSQLVIYGLRSQRLPTELVAAPQQSQPNNHMTIRIRWNSLVDFGLNNFLHAVI